MITEHWGLGQIVTVFSDDPPFTASDGVTLVDPDIVTVTFACQGQTDIVCTYGDDGSPIPVIRVSAGVYSCAFDSGADYGSPGVWNATYKGRPDNGPDPTQSGMVSQPYQFVIDP
jgi:hypothetical protein